jgi:uncharacterized protein YceK
MEKCFRIVAVSFACVSVIAMSGCTSVPGMTSPIPGGGGASANTKLICDSLRGSLDAGAPGARQGKIDTMKKYSCPDTPAH